MGSVWQEIEKIKGIHPSTVWKGTFLAPTTAATKDKTPKNWLIGKRIQEK